MGRPALAGRPRLGDRVRVAAERVLETFARADAAPVRPRLGGMARPNGVVVSSERFWAFASTTGELHEGMLAPLPARASRIPLVRGLAQLAAALRPLARGAGVARGRERALLLAAIVAPLVLLPLLPAALELPATLALGVALVAWLMRGRTLRLHGAEHRAIAAAERGLLVATWDGRAQPTRFAARCGTNFAALALPVTVVVERAWPFGGAPALAGAAVVLLSLGATMEVWRAAQHPSGLLRGLLLPGLALQRLTTREPALDDTRVALRAAASVLRRELGNEGQASDAAIQFQFSRCRRPVQ
jgi:hypothetical protein